MEDFILKLLPLLGDAEKINVRLGAVYAVQETISMLGLGMRERASVCVCARALVTITVPIPAHVYLLLSPLLPVSYSLSVARGKKVDEVFSTF